MITGIVGQFLYEKFANLNEISIESFYTTVTRNLPTYCTKKQLLDSIYWSKKFYPLWGINDAGGWLVSESAGFFIESNGNVHYLTFDENYRPIGTTSKPKRLYLYHKNHISGNQIGTTIFYHKFYECINFLSPNLYQSINYLNFINYDKKFLPQISYEMLRIFGDYNFEIWFYKDDAKLFSIIGNFLLCPSDNLLDHIFGPNYTIGSKTNGFNFYSNFEIVYKGNILHTQNLS